MSDADDIGEAYAEAHNVKRELFLHLAASGSAAKLKIYGPSGLLIELEDGWNVELQERQETATGERYYNLFVDDLDGSRLTHLKTMTKVRINSVEFKFLTKPSFLSAVPTYQFRAQPMTQS